MTFLEQSINELRARQFEVFEYEYQYQSALREVWTAVLRMPAYRAGSYDFTMWPRGWRSQLKGALRNLRAGVVNNSLSSIVVARILNREPGAANRMA